MGITAREMCGDPLHERRREPGAARFKMSPSRPTFSPDAWTGSGRSRHFFLGGFSKKRSLVRLISRYQPDIVSEIEYQGHISPDKGLITRYQSVADISLIY